MPNCTIVHVQYGSGVTIRQRVLKQVVMKLWKFIVTINK